MKAVPKSGFEPALAGRIPTISKVGQGSQMNICLVIVNKTLSIRHGPIHSKFKCLMHPLSDRDLACKSVHFH